MWSMSSSAPRTPPRSTTPTPISSIASPSRLNIPPSLRSSPSLSNLRVHSSVSSALPGPSPISHTLDSTASSVINLDLNENILTVDDSDMAEVDDMIVAGQVGDRRDEESKKTLREQLRKTLNSKHESPSFRPRQKHREEPTTDRFPPREYFVLTDAGKPVFTSRQDSDNIASVIGIMQALISVFQDEGDKIRCINAGNTRITFMMRTPLYYTCVSAWGEPEAVARSHLEYLHLQIISIVSGGQLRRIFERRTNFDLRRLLNGTESFLVSMLKRLEFDLAMSISALHCMRIDSALRKKIAETLVPPAKMKEVLYVVLVANGRVITLIRPKKHSIHPADIHILLNTIENPSILNSAASAMWLPICLPKFNSAGFVNAYISFLNRDSEDASTPTTELTQSDGNTTDQIDTGITLVCISGGEFETIRTWCDSVALKLKTDGHLETLSSCISGGHINYTVAELSIPGLRHFIYKSRVQVQVTYPIFEDPYDSIDERRRLITLYQTLHDNIHAKSGQEEPLKLQYIKTETESVMGWITQPFELYISLSPRLPKSAAVNAANAVARWVKKEEQRLFLKDAPVF